MRAAIFKGKGRILLAPRAGRSEAVRTLLHSLVEPSRQEEGCLGYDLYAGRGADATVVLVGRWASPAAFDAHLAQPAVRQAFDTDIVDLLTGPPVAHVTAAVTDPHRA